MPKSPIWKVPELLQKMLSGLMSMTMTPWLCRKSKPCACRPPHNPVLCKRLYRKGAYWSLYLCRIPADWTV